VDSVFFFIILFSLILSVLVSSWLLKRTERILIGIVAAFFINAVVLSISAIILYEIDVQTYHKQTSGVFGSLGILILAFFIPVNTFINHVIISISRIVKGS